MGGIFFKRSVPIPGPGVNGKKHLSFSGCGFLGVYHLGVAKVLGEHGQEFLKGTIDGYAGASGGALVAALLLLTGTEKIDYCYKFCRGIAEETRDKELGAMTPNFNLLKRLETFLTTLLPRGGNEYIKANGKLFISCTTRCIHRNILISEFESNEHLVKCLLASSYIPLVTGKRRVRVNGKSLMDGGFSNNLPLSEKGSDTVTVSPFIGTQNICPKVENGHYYTTVSNQDFTFSRVNISRGILALHPPKDDDFQRIYEQGKSDAKDYLTSIDKYESPGAGGKETENDQRQSSDEEDSDSSDEEQLACTCTPKGSMKKLCVIQ